MARVVNQPARDDLELTAIFHALSDPARLAMVCELAARIDEMSCSELNPDLTKSTLSHHLKVLREAGLTATRVDGVRRMVSLRAADLDARFPGLLDTVVRSAAAPVPAQA
ncbi:ArsR/SmtB family transcription factor [Nocardia sp. NPDC004750]